MASADGEQVDLAPEWLAKGHSLHSPAPHVSLSGLRDSWHGRGSNSSSRGHVTPDSPFLQQQQQQQQQRTSLPHGVSSLLTARSEEWPAKWCPRTSNHRSSSSSSSSSSSFGSSHQRSSHSSSRQSTYEERHHPLSSPFSPPAKGSNSSSHSRQFWPHKGLAAATGTASSSSSSSVCSAANQGQGQRPGPQHPLSESYGQHAKSQGVDDVSQKDNAQHSSRGRAASGAAARKLELNASEFPSLGASSSSNSNSSSQHSSSSLKRVSAAPYTPSVAPYKQEGFLASRASAGWTSKLADVPAAAIAGGTQPDAPAAHEHGRHSTAGAPEADSHSGTSSSNSSSSSAAGTRGGVAGSANMPTFSGDTGVTATADPSSAPQGSSTSSSTTTTTSSSSTSGVPAVVQQQPSLADTLKQAASASAGTAGSATQQASSQRRHSKTLVPLLPGCKAKPAGTTTRIVPAPSGSSSSRAAGAGLQSPTGLGHTPLSMLSHSSHSSHSSSSSATAAAAVTSPQHVATQYSSSTAADAFGVHGSTGPVSSPLHSPVGGEAGRSHTGTPQGLPSFRHTTDDASQPSKLTAGAGAAGAAEQRQQLRDRNSFFAVLRRKTTSTSSTESSGEQGDTGSGRGLSGSSGSSDCGAAADMHRGSDGAAATAGEEGGNSSSSRDAPPAAALQAAGTAADANANADADAGADASRTVTHVFLPAKQSEQEQQHNLADSHVQGDNAPASQGTSITADLDRQQQQQQCCSQPQSVSPLCSHPISASSSQDEEHYAHCEVHSPRQEHSCELSALQCPHSPQLENSNSASIMSWDLPAEEEEAFLRSLGWTAESSDDESDWGLTDEEIAAFQAKAAARAAAQQVQQQPQQQHGVLASAYGNLLMLQLQQKVQLLGRCDNAASPGADCSTGFAGFAGGAAGGVRGGVGVRGSCGWGHAGVGVSTARLVRGFGGFGEQAGRLFGAVHMPPAAAMAGYDSCEESSSSSDEDDDG